MKRESGALQCLLTVKVIYEVEFMLCGFRMSV